MSHPGTDDPSVLVVGTGGTAAALAARFESAATCETVAEAVARVDRGEAPAVVVAPAGADGADALGERWHASENPAVVLWFEGDDPGRASDALASGVADVARIDGESDLDLLVARVERAAERRVLERESDMLDSLLDDLPLFVYFKDREGRYVRVSDVDEAEFQDMEGRTDAEIYSYLDQAGSAEIEREERQVVEDGQPVIRKEVDRPAPTALEGEWSAETKIPWRDAEGNVRGLVGVTDDITALKEREAELQRQNERLEEFASIVSHDLRNPLNVAQGYHRLLKDTEFYERADEEAVEKFHAIADALVRMQSLINDLLTLARKGRTVEAVEPVAFEDVVHDAWAAVETGDATLSVDVDDPTIEADRARVQQALENLFRNAIDHVGPDVHVRVGRDGDALFVADDGPGIPPDQRQLVFAHGHTTSEDGTGLGLSIVRSIVEAHGWEITATESEIGGARFEITGLDYADETAEAAARGSASVSPGDTRRLVVEAAGRNIWQQVNEFHFVCVPVEGDAVLTARVADLDPVDQHSKAGLMVRNDLGEHAAHAFVGLKAGETSEIIRAIHPADRSRSVQAADGASAPHWYRIERTGGTVVGYASSDGEHWREVGRASPELDEEVYVGLAVCAVTDGDEPMTAVFDNVEGLDGWEAVDVGDGVDGSVRVVDPE